MEERRWRAARIIAFLAALAGIAGFIAALGDPFANPMGSLLGKLLYFNQLGAIVTGALALAGLAGAVSRKNWLLLLAGVGFAACAILTVIQTGRDPNWLGGRGNTLSLFLACAVGLLALAIAPTEAPSDDRFSTDTPPA